LWVCVVTGWRLGGDWVHYIGTRPTCRLQDDDETRCNWPTDFTELASPPELYKVCVHVCVHVCVSVYVCICVYVYVCVSVCMHTPPPHHHPSPPIHSAHVRRKQTRPQPFVTSTFNDAPVGKNWIFVFSPTSRNYFDEYVGGAGKLDQRFTPTIFQMAARQQQENRPDWSAAVDHLGEHWSVNG